MRNNEEMLLFKRIGELGDLFLVMIEILPNRFNFTLKDHLFNLFLEISELADEANQTKVFSEQTFYERVWRQNQILAHIKSSERLVRLAVRARGLTPAQAENWSNKAREVWVMTLAWIKTDNHRYAKFRNNKGNSTNGLASHDQSIGGVALWKRRTPVTR